MSLDGQEPIDLPISVHLQAVASALYSRLDAVTTQCRVIAEQQADEAAIRRDERAETLRSLVEASGQTSDLVDAALEHALVAYDFDPNNPGAAPLGFARAAVEHALSALRDKS